MITLYRTKNCPQCSRIQEALEDMAVAHGVKIVDTPDDVPEDTSHNTLPVLVDGDTVIEGMEAVSDHLEDVEEFKRQWYKFQSDACYCDEEGDIE